MKKAVFEIIFKKVGSKRIMCLLGLPGTDQFMRFDVNADFAGYRDYQLESDLVTRIFESSDLKELQVDVVEVHVLGTTVPAKFVSDVSARLRISKEVSKAFQPKLTTVNVVIEERVPFEHNQRMLGYKPSMAFDSISEIDCGFCLSGEGTDISDLAFTCQVPTVSPLPNNKLPLVRLREAVEPAIKKVPKPPKVEKKPVQPPPVEIEASPREGYLSWSKEEVVAFCDEWEEEVFDYQSLSYPIALEDLLDAAFADEQPTGYKGWLRSQLIGWKMEQD